MLRARTRHHSRRLIGGPSRPGCYPAAEGDVGGELRLRTEPDERRAEVRCHIIPELLDVRVTVEGGLYDPALHAASAPMDEPDVAKPGVRGRCDVFLNDGGNVARGEGVQIELGFDGNAVEVWHACYVLCFAFS